MSTGNSDINYEGVRTALLLGKRCHFDHDFGNLEIRNTLIRQISQCPCLLQLEFLQRRRLCPWVYGDRALNSKLVAESKPRNNITSANA